jgi:Uma2 family endonuclease
MEQSALAEAIHDFLERQHPEHDVEIREGEIVVVSPHDLVSSNIVLRLGGRLSRFVEAHALGYVFDSNGGFRYADGDLMAPDITYISRSRLPSVPRAFATDAIPELVVEVQSSTQNGRAVRRKLETLLDKGSTVGLYVDPGARRVEIHRAHRPPVVLAGDDVLELPDVLPGLRIPLPEIWPPSYD